MSNFLDLKRAISKRSQDRETIKNDLALVDSKMDTYRQYFNAVYEQTIGEQSLLHLQEEGYIDPEEVESRVEDYHNNVEAKLQEAIDAGVKLNHYCTVHGVEPFAPTTEVEVVRFTANHIASVYQAATGLDMSEVTIDTVISIADSEDRALDEAYGKLGGSHVDRNTASKAIAKAAIENGTKEQGSILVIGGTNKYEINKENMTVSLISTASSQGRYNDAKSIQTLEGMDLLRQAVENHAAIALRKYDLGAKDERHEAAKEKWFGTRNPNMYSETETRDAIRDVLLENLTEEVERFLGIPGELEAYENAYSMRTYKESERTFHTEYTVEFFDENGKRCHEIFNSSLQAEKFVLAAGLENSEYEMSAARVENKDHEGSIYFIKTVDPESNKIVYQHTKDRDEAIELSQNAYTGTRGSYMYELTKEFYENEIEPCDLYGAHFLDGVLEGRINHTIREIKYDIFVNDNGTVLTQEDYKAIVTDIMRYEFETFDLDTMDIEEDPDASDSSDDIEI